MHKTTREKSLDVGKAPFLIMDASAEKNSVKFDFNAEEKQNCSSVVEVFVDAILT